MSRPRFRRILWFLVKCAIAATIVSMALVAMFRFVTPPTSAVMIERRIDAWRNRGKYAAHYDWVDFDHIAPLMGVAVIASEDQNFLRHHGFDWQAIQKAIDHNNSSDRIRGASTLTQQTAKNLFLWPGRDWVRKGMEAYLTVLMETLWGKRRILETYLNIAEFGDGIYGVEAAAQRYFGKPANRLSAEEAALLAAVLPNPIRFKANAPSAYVRERQQWILQQMDQLGGVNLLKAIH